MHNRNLAVTSTRQGPASIDEKLDRSDLRYPYGSHDPRGTTEVLRVWLTATNEVVCMSNIEAEINTHEWGRILARSINAVSMARDEDGDDQALVDELVSSLNEHLEKEEEEEI